MTASRRFVEVMTEYNKIQVCKDHRVKILNLKD